MNVKKQIGKKWYKWVSSLIVCCMILQISPVSGLSLVFAEANETKQAKDEPKEQITKLEGQEVINRRTENSKTFLNADGTLRAEISQKPIHFKNDRNKWEPIDNDLVENVEEQVYENKANAFKVKFDKKQIPNTSFMALEDKEDSIELQIEPLDHTNEKPAAVEGVVEGESITYPEVFSNIDIKYKVGADRIKEDIIYTEKPKEGFPEQFTYKMDLDGMKVKESGGTIYLYDEDSSKPLYYFDSPYMYDSYRPKGFKSVSEIDSIPEEAISYEIQLDYEVIDNQIFLHVIPSKTWLEDPSRIYPITIDPTLVKLQSTPYVEDTNIRKGFPTQTGGNDLELAGGKSGTNVIRGLLKFDLSSIPTAATITDANLNLWYSSTNNNTPIDISVHRVTKGWEENQANWNSAKTSPATPWSVQGGDFVSTPISTVSGIGALGDLLTGEMSWDIPTSLINSWTKNPTTNYGLLLKSDTENVDTYKKFISSEHTIDSRYHPLLVVTYKTTARLGLEDYWEYDSHQLVGGNVYTNLTTGNNVIQYRDFNLPSRGGYDFDFVRTYNSKSLEKSIFGYGWTATGLENLFINSNEKMIDYTDKDGTTHSFTYNADKDLYLSGPGLYLTIRKYTTNTNGYRNHFYEMMDNNGEKTLFKSNKMDINTNTSIASLESKEDRHGNRITFKYDTNNRLIQIVSQLTTNLVKSIEFTYNAAGFVETSSYEGNIFKYEYDSNGKVQNVKQLKSGENYTKTTFEYNEGDRISAIVDPNKRRTDFTYQNEMIIKVQEPNINQDVDRIDRPGTTYSLDTVNKKSTVTDPEGNKTTYYLNDNYVATRIVGNGIESNYKLDDNYNVEMQNDNGKITLNTYDKENGNLLTTTDPEGNKQTYTYTKYGNVSTDTDSNQITVTYSYNQNGDMEKIEIPDRNAKDGKLITFYEYDEFGDIKSITQPDGSKQLKSIDYKNSIQTSTNTDAFGNMTIVKTDLKGNVLETKDEKNQIFSFSYNSKNELEKVVDPKLHITTYGYDLNGNINSIRNARNFESTYVYNGQNLLQEEINELGNKTIYDYDSNGNIKNIQLSNNSNIQNVYDGSSRLAEIYLDGVLKWKYNFDGDHLVSIHQGTTLYKSFDYYNNDLVKSIHEGSNLIEYSYKGENYKSEVKYSIGNNTPSIIEYVPDDIFRSKEVKKNDELIALFQYDQSGLPQTLSYKNGSSISMQYDRGRLSNYTLKNQPDHVLDGYSFEYYPNHNIKKIISNAGITEFEYDELNQLKIEKLTSGTILSYEYDEVGNRKKKSKVVDGDIMTVNYEYNGMNQLTKVGNQDYQYDKNGNLKSDGNRIFVYNNFNQLEEIKDTSGKNIASYTYDEQGKRKSTTTSLGTVQYYYDGDNVLYETDGNNKVLNEYTYDDKDHPLTMTTNGQTYYYLINYRGDVIALTDSTGNVVASYTYDAWGNVLTQSGQLASQNPYRYAGYRYDENTKLYYLIARYYSPENGAFLSFDPVRGDLAKPITQNGYTYANNNPVLMVDPTGDAATAGTYVIPLVGTVTLLVTGAIVFGNMVYKAGSWIGQQLNVYLAEKNEKEKIAKDIPAKLKDGNTKVNLGKFTKRVNSEKNKTFEDEKSGWRISQEKSKGNGHGGSAWKLENNKKKRIATLDKYGNILRK